MSSNAFMMRKMIRKHVFFFGISSIHTSRSCGYKNLLVATHALEISYPVSDVWVHWKMTMIWLFLKRNSGKERLTKIVGF